MRWQPEAIRRPNAIAIEALLPKDTTLHVHHQVDVIVLVPTAAHATKPVAADSASEDVVRELLAKANDSAVCGALFVPEL